MLTRKSMKQLDIPDRIMSDLQENVVTLLDPIAKVAILDGLQVTATLSANPTSIAHQLGRRYRGYMLVRSTGPVQIWDTKADNTDHPDLYLVLRYTGTAGTVVQLWVY